jgi:hypothetical protein
LVRFFAQGSISKEDFDGAMVGLGTELAQVDAELPSQDVTETELSSLLDFTEWLLPRIGGVWSSATAPNKQRLQAALFPDGLTASKEGLGTAKTPLFFMACLESLESETSLASPEGFEPSLPP